MKKLILLIILQFVFFACKSEEEKMTEVAKVFLQEDIKQNKEFKSLDSLKLIKVDTITHKRQALEYWSQMVDKLKFYSEMSELSFEKYKSSKNMLGLYSMLDSPELIRIQTSDTKDDLKEYKMYDDSLGILLKKSEIFKTKLDKFDSIKPVNYYHHYNLLLRRKDNSILRDTVFIVYDLDKNIIRYSDYLKDTKKKFEK